MSDIKWRKLLPDDLDMDADTPTRINGEVRGTIGSQRDYMLPGHVPFLIGMQAFWTVEVPDTDETGEFEDEDGPTRDVLLTLRVTVPADVSDETVVRSVDAALDEPGKYPNDWGNWIVGGVEL